MAPHSGQISQLVFEANDRNAQFLSKVREALYSGKSIRPCDDEFWRLAVRTYGCSPLY